MNRSIYSEEPPRVEYVLTDPGRSLLELMKGLVASADENQAAIRSAPGFRDVRDR